MAFDKTKHQREYQAKQNAAAGENTIRKCSDRTRRKEVLGNPEEILKWYFSDRFTRPFTDDQLETIETIVDCARFGSDEIFCAPRGDLKTETTKGMVIYRLLNQVVLFPLIIGSTAADASLKFEDIKGQFEKNHLLADDFPEICDPIMALDGSPQKAKKQTVDGARTDIEWKADFCTFPQHEQVPGSNEPSPYGRCAMTYRGLDGQIRGINIKGFRPDIATCNDLETWESADSDHQIEIRERLLKKFVGGLAGGGERLPRIVLGTFQSFKCHTIKKLKEWGGRRCRCLQMA